MQHNGVSQIEKIPNLFWNICKKLTDLLYLLYSLHHQYILTHFGSHHCYCYDVIRPLRNRSAHEYLFNCILVLSELVPEPFLNHSLMILGSLFQFYEFVETVKFLTCALGWFENIENHLSLGEHFYCVCLVYLCYHLLWTYPYC